MPQQNWFFIKDVFFVTLFFIVAETISAQSGYCNNSEPFCTNDITTFPAGVDMPDAEPGPYYGCLSSQPNPAWYHMRIASPGNITIQISSNPPKDIDFICWGPFSDPHAPCANQLIELNEVDCSYAYGTEPEVCAISTTFDGEYYILLITNYSNDECAISFEKISGTGETDCGIVPAAASNNGPICVGETLELYAEFINNATYTWSGPNSFTSNLQNPTIPNAQLSYAGIYNVVVSLGGNSSIPYPTEVIINANPVADFIFYNTCIGDEVQFNDLSTCATPATPIQTWQWNFGDGNTSALQNPTHTYDPSGPPEFDVSLNVITTGGCENEIVKHLVLYPLPEVNFTYIAACTGAEVEFFDESSCINPDIPIVEWLWDFGDGGTSTEQNPVHIYSGGGPTSFTVTLTATTSAGCQNQISSSVELYQNPTADFEYTFVDGSSCIESVVSFNDESSANEGQIVSWLWDFGDGNSSNIQNPTHSYSDDGTYIISLIVENSSGCTDQNQLPVTIHDYPFIDFSYNTVCFGNATEFIDSDYINMSETESWLYDFGDGNTSTESNPSHIYQSSGNFTVIFTITNVHGCSNSISKVVEVNELPQAAFNSSTVCLYSPTQFTNQSTSQSGFEFFEWDFGDGNTSTLQHPTHTFENYGLINVQLVVGSTEGCLDTVVEPVTIWKPPVANFNSSDSACMSGLVYFSDSSYSNESEVTQYFWNFPDGHISLDANTYFVFLNTDIFYNISLMVTDDRWCRDTITETIFINPELSMNFNSDTACFGQSTELSAYIIEPQTDSIVQYTWVFQDGSPQITTTNRTINHEFTHSGIFDVQMQALNTFGCENTVRRTVKVWQNPQANFSFQESFCNDSSLFFDESLPGENNLSTWVWNFGDGTNHTIHAPNPSNTFHHYAPYHYQYNTQLAVIDANGCQDSISRQMNHFPCVMVNFYNDTTWICQNTPAVFIDSTVCDSEYNINQKTWIFGDGESAVVPPDTDTILHQYQTHGIYNAGLLVTYELDGMIVMDSLKKQVSISASPQISFTTQNLCLGIETPFINSSHIAADMLEWSIWNYGDGQDTTINYTTGINEHYHRYDEDGEYQIKLIIKASNNCIDSTSMSLVVHPVPQIGFLADTTIHCKNARIILTDTSLINSGTIANRLWTFGDGDYLSTSNDTVSHVYSSGIFSVSLQNTSNHFCQSTLTLEDYILINPIEKADFRVEPEEISIESISNLGIINNVSNDSYLRWALCDTIFWENVYTPNIVDSIFDTGFYHLKMYTINEFGCMDSLEKTFIVTPVYNFYIPSAFSPNENGINDTFGPVGKYFDMQSYELKIYNRWGQVVFQTHDFFQHWDGKMTNGLRAPMGTYAYIIKLADMDGNNKLIRGSVSLLL